MKTDSKLNTPYHAKWKAFYDAVDKARWALVYWQDVEEDYWRELLDDQFEESFDHPDNIEQDENDYPNYFDAFDMYDEPL